MLTSLALLLDVGRLVTALRGAHEELGSTAVRDVGVLVVAADSIDTDEVAETAPGNRQSNIGLVLRLREANAGPIALRPWLTVATRVRDAVAKHLAAHLAIGDVRPRVPHATKVARDATPDPAVRGRSAGSATQKLGILAHLVVRGQARLVQEGPALGAPPLRNWEGPPALRTSRRRRLRGDAQTLHGYLRLDVVLGTQAAAVGA